jgi:hypothetical protein
MDEKTVDEGMQRALKAAFLAQLPQKKFFSGCFGGGANLNQLFSC